MTARPRIGRGLGVAVAALLGLGLGPVPGSGAARAGEVAIASAAAVRAPLDAAAALSRAAIGEGLAMSFGTAGAVRDRVAGGGAVDIVVLPPARLDDLVRQGLVEADGRQPLGTVRLGLAVKAGAPHPALGSEAELRATLREASAIGLADPASGATTGLFFARRLGELGLAETLRPKIRLFPDGTAAVEALARGEVSVALGQISEIRPVRGAELAGPLPDDVQLRTVYAAGIARRSARPGAARAVIAFLRSPRMAASFAAAGFDPPAASPQP